LPEEPRRPTLTAGAQAYLDAKQVELLSKAEKDGRVTKLALQKAFESSLGARPAGTSVPTQPGPGTAGMTGNYMTLRKAVGWIGVCLPFAIYLGNWVIFSHHVFGCLAPVSDKLPDSLSGYYYTHMRDAFVGGMLAAGVFLLFYQGHDWVERWATNLAGLFAIGIAWFPTAPPTATTNAFLQTNSCGPVTPLVLQPSPHGFAIGVVHVVCLCGLMLMIAVMAWRFTRVHSTDEMNAMTKEDKEIESTPRLKRRNNIIYRGCVVAMAVAGVFAVVQQVAFSAPIKRDAPWLLYAEALAFLAFGTAWFVQGRALQGLGKAVRTVLRPVTSARRRGSPQTATPVAAGP
jgi:hypothetical protein